MEYAKDNIIKLHTLKEEETVKEKVKNEKRTSKIVKALQKHKLITTILALLLVFSVLNTILIYNFFKILTTI